jgi:SEC-C motif domain protein
MSLCPCGSQENYEQCCGRFINCDQLPRTPEQLMRSRYSAYSLAKIDYITMTMRGPPLLNFNAQEAKEWSQSLTWIGLTIIQSYMESADHGFVEFSASYLERNRIKIIHELSEFQKENNTWFYVDGTHKQSPGKNYSQPVARNSLCPCGSGKKFKNCHEK